MGFGRRPISRTLLEEADMKITSRVFSGTLAALAMVAVTAGPVRAVDIGEPAPDFRLPSTFGRDISLGAYIEFREIDDLHALQEVEVRKVGRHQALLG
jgi:hypothetical protein